MKNVLQTCPGSILVMVDINCVRRSQDRATGVQTAYDTHTDAICNVLAGLMFQDLHALRHPLRRDYSFFRKGLGTSRIDTFWANPQLLANMNIAKLKSAVAAKHGPLCVDHTPIAVSLNLQLKVDPAKGIRETIAISTSIRPRRGKPFDEKRKKLFQDALDDGDAFGKSAKNFMQTQPVEWTLIVDSLSTIGLQGLVLTHDLIETAMRAAIQQDQVKHVQDQPAYAIRKKKLCTSAVVLMQVLTDCGQEEVDLTAQRNTCLQGMQLIVEDLHGHCMRA